MKKKYIGIKITVLDVSDVDVLTLSGVTNHSDYFGDTLDFDDLYSSKK